MLNRMLTFTALAAGLALAAAAVPSQAFPASPRANTLTFTAPVALPGVVLAAGSYVFEAGPLDVDRRIVRVTSRNHQQVYYLGLTNAARRPTWMPQSQVLVMGEAGPGRATPIRAWYPLGSSNGFEFLY
jgi:hypothetical protein